MVSDPKAEDLRRSDAAIMAAGCYDMALEGLEAKLPTHTAHGFETL